MNELINIDFYELKKKSQSLALLDAIVMPDWEYRYFSFNSRWDVESGQEVASMRTGEGDEYYILFENGSFIGKIFCCNFPVIDEALKSEIPVKNKYFLNEPAFSNENSNLYFWRDKEYPEANFLGNTDATKMIGLQILLGSENDYQKWAEHYYEVELKEEIVNSLFKKPKVEYEEALRLNPDLEEESFCEDISEIFG